MKAQTTNIGRILSLCCFVTVISQLPIFVSNGTSSYISQIVWACFFIYLIFAVKKIRISSTLICFLGITYILILYMVVMYIFTGVAYHTSGIFLSVLSSMFVFTTSYMAGVKIEANDLELSAKSYIIAAIIVAVDVYIKFFRGQSISGSEYLYSSKNSLALILMIAVILLFTYGYKKENRRIVKMMITGLIAFFLFLIFILKCRAVIVGIPVLFCVVMFTSGVSKKIKFLACLVCVGLLIALTRESIYNTIVNDIIFAGRGDTFVEASSGRLDMWKNFFSDMQGKWLIGDGQSFRESLILAAIMKYGVLVGLTIIAIAFYPIVKGIRSARENSKHGFALLLIAISCFIDCIFEQLAPFGPGARCFYLWMLIGIICSNAELLNINKESEVQ